MKLMISRTDLHYAYGQMKFSKETTRQCVFAITGEGFGGCYRITDSEYVFS